jgi:ATPase complex subunit ATP10
LKAFLVNLFVRQLREAVPRELHDTYLISTQNMEYIREPLGMTNSQVGYVYLVDENLRIRWAACAEPTQEEIQALESCTGVLLNRLERKLGSAKTTQGVKPTTEPMA